MTSLASLKSFSKNTSPSMPVKRGRSTSAKNKSKLSSLRRLYISFAISLSSPAYDIAKSNAEFLEENTLLRAPFDGTITGKYYEDGEFYSGAPNTAAGKAAIISIMQIDPLKAIVNI